MAHRQGGAHQGRLGEVVLEHPPGGKRGEGGEGRGGTVKGEAGEEEEEVRRRWSRGNRLGIGTCVWHMGVQAWV